MRHIIILIMLGGALTSMVHAHCDLTKFRWECDLRPRPRPPSESYSLVYCGNTQMYLTKQAYEQLAQYQHANVEMVLRINGEYISGPCVPAGRFRDKDL